MKKSHDDSITVFSEGQVGLIEPQKAALSRLLP
jgi:hypothetical protein